MQQVTSPRLQAAAQAIFDETMRVEGNVVAHDPGAQNHVVYMEEMARLHGYTPERYPALFASFEKPPTLMFAANAGDNTGAFVDNQIVDYLAALQGSNLASAHAIITRTKPVASMFVTMSVMNVDGPNKTVLASGATNSFGQQTTEVQTDDATALPMPSTGQNYATIGWSIQYMDDSTETHYTSSQWAYRTAADPTVSAPAINPNRLTGNLNNIMVGLSRGFNSPANNSDIDYWFWQTQWQNTTLLVPFVGSMCFTKPIAPLSSANPRLCFYMARSEGGMKELTAGNTQPYLSGFKINTSDPKRLDFTLQANSNDAGNAINFGLSPWVADTQTFFTAKVIVTLQDGSPGWSSVISSLKPDTSPTDGVLYIKPIMYVWHCLAAGTQITMSDGTTQLIENLNVGMSVKSAGGANLNVQATLAQPHWGTVYVITTRGGAQLTCSGTHPMMTPEGPATAASLTPGAVVLMQNGHDVVSSITTQQQSGDGLFNVWLAGSEGQTTFFANGFLVGDYQMQVALLPSNNPETLRAKLPAHLLTDFESHLQDTGAKPPMLSA